MLKLFQTKNNQVRQSLWGRDAVKHLTDFKDVDFKDEQIICEAVGQMDSGRPPQGQNSHMAEGRGRETQFQICQYN
jgi:hypothetical protein